MKFAGNGSEDVSGGMPRELPSASLTDGGPVVFPKGAEQGMSCGSCEATNYVGGVETGGGVTFTKGNDW